MSPRRPRAAGFMALVALMAAQPARATPGPDSVAVLVNADLPGSVALGAAYAQARAVPSRQVCALPLPDTSDLTLADFQDLLALPLRACLDAAGVLPRIEAIVLARGVPLRVLLPPESGGGRVSLAAALGLWNSTSLDTGAPILGTQPSRLVPCGPDGQTCPGAAWRNPYTGGRFRPGYTLDSVGIHWETMLVTALFARSDADAARLIDASVDSDGYRNGGNGGAELLLMDAADPARGALDADFDFVLPGLVERGLPVRRVPFDSDLTGLTLAGFVTGTAGLGRTIEGNAFVPGALVDNLTSFGAVAENFAAEGESQVSIARWVAQGVTGVHGTTDEPLNNCFPRRQFLLDYADGATLAEAFHSNLPFVYWHNLVLGDPMAAPYAVRPVVALDVPPGVPPAPGLLGVTAADPAERGAPALVAYADGLEVARDEAGQLALCVAAGPPTDWLFVAQARDDGRPGSVWAPKGWHAERLDLVPADGCAAPDASVAADPDATVPGDAASSPDVAPPDGATEADARPLPDGPSEPDSVADSDAGPVTDAESVAPTTDLMLSATPDAESVDASPAAGATRFDAHEPTCRATPGRPGSPPWGDAALLSLLASAWALRAPSRRGRARRPVEGRRAAR